MTLEYDAIGDFPAYANPLSLANAAAGMYYVHGDQGPDNVDLANDRQVSKTTTTNGTDTYVLVLADHLPLLQPVRDVSATLKTTQLTEPVLEAVEPTLRLGVDMGYTDRDYSNADKPTRFSLITPPERIAETAKALPDAIQQGADALRPAVTPKPVQRPTLKPPISLKAPEKPKSLKPAKPRDPIGKAISNAVKQLKPTKKKDTNTG